MKTFKLIGISQFLLLFIFFYSHAHPNQLEPGIYFTPEGHFKSVVTENNQPPNKIWRGKRIYDVSCQFISPDDFRQHANLFPEEYQKAAKDDLEYIPPAKQALFCYSDAPFAEVKSFHLHLDYPIDFTHCQESNCLSEQNVTVRLITPTDQNQGQSMLLIRTLECMDSQHNC